jgi:N4-bis(aminopropyl)spermidine synthase
MMVMTQLFGADSTRWLLLEPLLRVIASETVLNPRVEELVLRSGVPREPTLEVLRTLGLQEGVDFPKDVDEVVHEIRRSLQLIDDGRTQARESLKRHQGRIHEILSQAPVPRARLDHVAATPDTAILRANYLIDRLVPGTSRLLMLGDHDLSTLPLWLSGITPHLKVADIDELTLEFIGNCVASLSLESHESSPSPQTAFADFRAFLPTDFIGSCDAVLTDPPYTPEGVSTFLLRAGEALDLSTAFPMVYLAFGHSRTRVDLGQSVQSQIIKSGFVIDSMRKGFNVYHGAQAVGSRSDMYACQPVKSHLRSVIAPKRRGEVRAHRVYTHGTQSIESTPQRLGPSHLQDLLARGEKSLESALLVLGVDGSDDIRRVLGKHQVSQEKAWSGFKRVPTSDLVIDARGQVSDAAPHLLLASYVQASERTLVLFDASRGARGEWERSLKAASDLLELDLGDTTMITDSCAYIELTLRSSGFKRTVGSWLEFASKAHGKAGNILRECLISSGRAASKNEARDQIAKLPFSMNSTCGYLSYQSAFSSK